MQEGAQQLNSGHASMTWSHELLLTPPQHSRGDRVAFGGDSVTLVTTRWQSWHRNTPPSPRGPPGTLRLPLCRWPPWVAKLLAGASHLSTHTWSLWRPICVTNCAWKAGTELPKGKGKPRKVHDQSGRVQLQDGEYLETPKASRGHDCQLCVANSSFPCHTSSRECRAMTNRLFVQTHSKLWWWCQRCIRTFVDRTKGCTKMFTKQST